MVAGDVEVAGAAVVAAQKDINELECSSDGHQSSLVWQCHLDRLVSKLSDSAPAGIVSGIAVVTGARDEVGIAVVTGVDVVMGAWVVAGVAVWPAQEHIVKRKSGMLNTCGYCVKIEDRWKGGFNHDMMMIVLEVQRWSPRKKERDTMEPREYLDTQRIDVLD